MERNHASADKIMVIRIVILRMNLLVCYVLRNKIAKMDEVSGLYRSFTFVYYLLCL